jgi:hypothetical protein
MALLDAMLAESALVREAREDDDTQTPQTVLEAFVTVHGARFPDWRALLDAAAATWDERGRRTAEERAQVCPLPDAKHVSLFSIFQAGSWHPCLAALSVADLKRLLELQQLLRLPAPVEEHVVQALLQAGAHCADLLDDLDDYRKRTVERTWARIVLRSVRSLPNFPTQSALECQLKCHVPLSPIGDVDLAGWATLDGWRTNTARHTAGGVPMPLSPTLKTLALFGHTDELLRRLRPLGDDPIADVAQCAAMGGHTATITAVLGAARAPIAEKVHMGVLACGLCGGHRAVLDMVTVPSQEIVCATVLPNLMLSGAHDLLVHVVKSLPILPTLETWPILGHSRRMVRVPASFEWLLHQGYRITAEPLDTLLNMVRREVVARPDARPCALLEAVKPFLHRVCLKGVDKFSLVPRALFVVGLELYDDDTLGALIDVATCLDSFLPPEVCIVEKWVVHRARSSRATAETVARLEALMRRGHT